MIPYIVEDVILSRSPRVANVSAEFRRQQWNYLIDENNMGECLNLGKNVKSQPS